MATTMPTPSAADGKEKISDPINSVVPSKEHKWWLDNIDHKITPECRRLLENYSKISPEDVRQHIYDIREKAWAIRPYPCTGLGRFLDNLLAQSPAYKDVVARLKGGDSFIDIGCFLGQELRHLLWELNGAPTDQLHAVDIVNHWDLGYEFFRDKDTFKVDFFEDDMLQPREQLKALHGTMDVILVNQIFHQWNLENQIEGATQSLLQSPETWKEVWDEVGKRTGTQWKTESRLLTWEQLGNDPKESAYMGTDVLMMEFVITRE
ncbi:hypothetical protein BELL_0236g00160 [Botrytis elliptica]|uniref:Methyltransferase domain-containing protein n=1 Tax=Botrytis elliptica TaxID=278938 RepID=A0A4Z1K1E2_9HELO|nr:hypothetical protein BELL_0236g00160 [Botrytis elliptica]